MAKPVVQQNTASGQENNDVGEKIHKLQEEMSRQKQQFRDIEEAKRQKIPSDLVDKPRTNAQKLDAFIR